MLEQIDLKTYGGIILVATGFTEALIFFFSIPKGRIRSLIPLALVILLGHMSWNLGIGFKEVDTVPEYVSFLLSLIFFCFISTGIVHDKVIALVKKEKK